MDYRQDKQNCLGYALGVVGLQLVAEVYPRTFGQTPETPDPVTVFSKKLSSLGFANRKLVKYNDTLSEGEFVIAFWGMLPIADKVLGFDSFKYDFHVAKFEEGSWKHKPGWKGTPCTVELSDLLEDYGYDVMFFAVRKEAP